MLTTDVVIMIVVTIVIDYLSRQYEDGSRKAIITIYKDVVRVIWAFLLGCVLRTIM